MSLIEASHYFKTNKEGAQKIIAKYLRGANKAYLDSSYDSTVKFSSAFLTRLAKE